MDKRRSDAHSLLRGPNLCKTPRQTGQEAIRAAQPGGTSCRRSPVSVGMPSLTERIRINRGLQVMDIETGVERVLELFTRLHRLIELIKAARAAGASHLDHQAWSAIENDNHQASRASFDKALSTLDSPP